MRRELARPLPEGTLNDDMYLPLGAFFRGYRVILDDTAFAFDYPTPLAERIPPQGAHAGRGLPDCGVLSRPAGTPQSHVDPLLFAQARPSGDALGHDPRGRTLRLACLSAGNTGLSALQAAAYLLALSDAWLPANFPLRRLTSPLRTFAVLMMASLCALAILFVPAQCPLEGNPRQQRHMASTTAGGRDRARYRVLPPH